jgi:alkanesulfonate monooxygenase SsuD/methylene tetrahydromethanopterin reductase-like flavin-dependent oxidoreductase (luciferase family)
MSPCGKVHRQVDVSPQCPEPSSVESPYGSDVPGNGADGQVIVATDESLFDDSGDEPMANTLSHGRLEVGFVRGVPYEVSAVNSKPVLMSERMWGAQDLILKAWITHDGPFNWEGRFFQQRHVNIWPRPYQQPRPPVWVTAMTPGSAAKIADHGHVIAAFLTGYDGTRQVFEAYRARETECGRPAPGDDRFAYAALVYTGRTDDEGLAGARKLMWYVKANKVPAQFVQPPGYTPYFVRAASLSGGRSAYDFHELELEDLINEGIVFAGSPDTVRQQIETFYDRVGGFGHLLLMGQAGFLEHDETVAGITTFGSEVAPKLRDRHPQLAAVSVQD